VKAMVKKNFEWSGRRMKEFEEIKKFFVFYEYEFWNEEWFLMM